MKKSTCQRCYADRGIEWDDAYWHCGVVFCPAPSRGKKSAVAASFHSVALLPPWHCCHFGEHVESGDLCHEIVQF